MSMATLKDRVLEFMEEQVILLDDDENSRKKALTSEVMDFAFVYERATSMEKDFFLQSKVRSYFNAIEKVALPISALGPLFVARAAKLCLVFCLGQDQANAKLSEVLNVNGQSSSAV